MATYLITLVGDDRVGIVETVAETIRRHGGNWERSELAELGGKFAGIVMINVAEHDAAELLDALRATGGGLDIAIHEATDHPAATDCGADDGSQVRLRLDLVGNDRRGIVAEITAALRNHGLTIDRLQTAVTEAPMAGGKLFEAKAELRGPASALPAAQQELEALAAELMVDLTVATSAAVGRGG